MVKARKRRAAVSVALAVTAAACGGGGTEDTNASGQGGVEFSISAPEDGAEVSVPFTLEFSSSVPLGATDTGEHHVHVFFDGNQQDYEVVEADSFEVEDLSGGDHTVTASLRNADHSAAGVEDEIAVTASGSGGDPKDDDDGGINY